ncbi:MAG: hypothetical protein A2868_03755 [Candidatus Levybacteria bacterium RIFCSPHIGHO2_01_FULL_40_15b]|nr:MAG: hypothetical protein A2868_03755 [Candidatus Levybacteria bacterium RIFCSPHIGHO2_01_FULL_40_15b]
MNTAVIITKTEPATKVQAQRLAKDLGVSLSSLINAYLRQLVRTRRVEFDLGEEPSSRLKKILRQAEKNWKSGNHSPAFKTGEEAVAWLEKQGI